MNLRIDRWPTLYVMRPFHRHTSKGKLSIPILMYHSIADEDERGVHPYYRTAIPPSLFAAQMAALQQAGYSVIGLPEAVTILTDRSPNVLRGVVITFDDGFRNFYTNAFPVLTQCGFTATVFLPTAHIGDSPHSFQGKECLTWNEVQELQKHGISFGSHTVSHPQLYDLNAKAIYEEVVISKNTIEQRLGRAVQSFAYPFAFPQLDAAFKARLRETLRQAGYKNGVCTNIGRPGSSSDPFFLERLPINSGDDARLFQAKLAGAYDWVSKAQYLVKAVKSWARTRRVG